MTMATRRKTAPQIKRYWLSYDLGLRGNYESLYEWLDSQGAEECGEALATFHSKKSRDQLRGDLREALGDTARVRIYLIDRLRGGTFLIGKRKAAPWAGYSQTAEESTLDK
jgi:hypothetical protein